MLNGVRSMNKVFPLERVNEAYERMLSGRAVSRGSVYGVRRAFETDSFRHGWEGACLQGLAGPRPKGAENATFLATR